MSTREYKNRNDSFSESTGTEGANVPEDLELPSCTIEDVDRALFSLFDKQIPFSYKHKSGSRKAPVIFATGERFAVLRRQRPLRDKSGALVLPLISIMRTGVTQSAEMGAGTAQNVPMTVRKRLSEEDPIYQKILNKQAIQNADGLATDEAILDGDIDSRDVEPDKKRNYNKKKAAPGRIASRNSTAKVPMNTRRNKQIQPSIGNNIFEVISMPPPKYYTATYEVTFWAQYTLQMNDMINAMMSLYQSYSQRTFQLETPKGYWFVGYVGEALTSGNNFDDFTDSERLVRYSFEVKVPAYLIGPAYPGSPNPLRKFVSAPKISFDSIIMDKEFTIDRPNGIPTGNPDDLILDDLRTVSDPIPGQTIGGSSLAASDSRGIFKQRDASQISTRDINGDQIGGATSDDNRTKIIEIDHDPFTGKKVTKKLHVKTRTNRKGETVLRESLE